MSKGAGNLDLLNEATALERREAHIERQNEKLIALQAVEKAASVFAFDGGLLLSDAQRSEAVTSLRRAIDGAESVRKQQLDEQRRLRGRR